MVEYIAIDGERHGKPSSIGGKDYSPNISTGGSGLLPFG
jgi:hypothetical protein